MAAKWAATLKYLKNISRDLQTAECCDTRRFHLFAFNNLAPIGFPYFAGNYRGAEHFCLKMLQVRVPSDPRVGHPPEIVHANMLKFGDAIDRATAGLDFVAANPTWFTERELLYRLTNAAAAAFVLFLEIHPYANGNGHAGRYLLNSFMGRFGFWLSGFPVHKRPHPDYAALISQYRSGNTTPLLSFILSCI